MEKWDEQIKTLEEFFETAEIPKGPIRVTSYAVVTDMSKLISSHLSIVKANNGKYTFKPYLQRLMWVKRLIENIINEGL
jgi:hypothetical protein